MCSERTRSSATLVYFILVDYSQINAFLHTGLGDISFNGKTEFVKYVRFMQSSGTSSFSDVSVSNEAGSIFCNSECCDPNADKAKDSSGSNICVCKEGFVSTALGTDKVLTSNDSCLDCKDTNDCKLDGDVCQGSGSCWADYCDNGVCQAGVSFGSVNLFTITCPTWFLTINSFFFGQSFTLTTALGAQVSAILIGNFAENSTDSGGVIVESNVINLYGDVRKIFELSSPVTVNKVTNLQLSFSRVADSAQNIGLDSDSAVEVCLYEQRDGDFLWLYYSGDEKRCTTITQTNMDIPFGNEFFRNRQASVKYITFKQIVDGFGTPRAVSVQFSNVKFVASPLNSQIKNNGKCRDDNAEPDPIDGKCTCKFGFVSSNGGRELTNEVDACAQCIEPYGYDGDACFINRGCLNGLCNSGICEPGVSRDVGLKANLLWTTTNISTFVFSRFILIPEITNSA